jgi:hypothetical protein
MSPRQKGQPAVLELKRAPKKATFFGRIPASTNTTCLLAQLTLAPVCVRSSTMRQRRHLEVIGAHWGA